MASLNLAVLASILVGGDPTGPYDLETQFVRGDVTGGLHSPTNAFFYAQPVV
jgi:hypothetical protein